MRRRRKRGRQIQAIGVSRGGRTTKILALTHGLGRLVAFCLTAGHVADCRAAEGLLHGLPHNALVMADRAYDTNAIRQKIEQQGAVPNIPPRRTRIWKSCFSRVLDLRRPILSWSAHAELPRRSYCVTAGKGLSRRPPLAVQLIEQGISKPPAIRGPGPSDAAPAIS
ncbi:transposase [Lichenicoccus roseus]|uniref:Transposase n=1 Tax=Lichenicoccus roseus TaxID=2683649 RepID=A0A5R9J977_9PROT|nr:transposase [Lichenicoccus roseus]